MTCERYCNVTLDPNLTLVNQIQFLLTIFKIGGRAECQEPLLGVKSLACGLALCGIACRLHAWKSLKSKSNKMCMEAKLWEILAPSYLVLLSILATLKYFKLDFSKVRVRCGLSKTARKRGIRKILLREDCWAIRVSEAVYFVHKLTLGELSCADQKLHILIFFF